LSQLNCQLQALISIPDRELREEMPENYFNSLLCNSQLARDLSIAIAGQK
jgi:hypothetical protein